MPFRSLFGIPLILAFSTTNAESSPATSSWKASPVLYGVSVGQISAGFDVVPLQALRARLPEIRDLGANVLWLLPLTKSSSPGQGYDVVDYEALDPSLGSQDDLKAVVQDAHRLGLKVIGDMVLNHSSVDHPFVKDIAEKGTASRYFQFYQHEPLSGVPYAQHFHEKRVGLGSFIYYFWEALFNFDFSNQKLRSYLLKVLRTWMQKFDIDGYRFDASWAPSSRWREFYPSISNALRTIKRDAILLAEDKTGYPSALAGSGHPHLKDSGFDWAYDWNSRDPNWISKWSFDLEDGKTLFNEKDSKKAAETFIQAISYSENEYGIKPLRYLENNDTPGFRLRHSETETRFAALVMFMLPGVPLIFYGQEIGSAHDQWALPSFHPDRTIESYDPAMRAFYKSLITMRLSSPILSQGSLRNIRRISNSQVEFERVYQGQTVAIRLDFAEKTVSLDGKILSLP